MLQKRTQAALPYFHALTGACYNKLTTRARLDDLDAAIANAQGVSKHLRLLLD